jgi:hypothetical protein
MAKANVDIPVSSVMKSLMLQISITGLFFAKIRMWCGVRLIRFGVFIIGCKAEIKVNGDG